MSSDPPYNALKHDSSSLIMVPHRLSVAILVMLAAGASAVAQTGRLATTAKAESQGDALPKLTATTVQLPTFGISIDADGTLEARALKDFNGRLLRERMAAAKVAKPGDLWAVSKLRKVSLVKLEAALLAEIAAGRGPDEVMRSLAAVTRLQYVFCLPASDGKPGDIVVAVKQANTPLQVPQGPASFLAQ